MLGIPIFFPCCLISSMFFLSLCDGCHEATRRFPLGGPGFNPTTTWKLRRYYGNKERNGSDKRGNKKLGTKIPTLLCKLASPFCSRGNPSSSERHGDPVCERVCIYNACAYKDFSVLIPPKSPLIDLNCLFSVSRLFPSLKEVLFYFIISLSCFF